MINIGDIKPVIFEAADSIHTIVADVKIIGTEEFKCGTKWHYAEVVKSNQIAVAGEVLLLEPQDFQK